MRTCIVYPGMDRAGTLRRATPRCFGCARRLCRDARFCGAKAFPLPESGKGPPAGKKTVLVQSLRLAFARHLPLHKGGLVSYSEKNCKKRKQFDFYSVLCCFCITARESKAFGSLPCVKGKPQAARCRQRRWRDCFVTVTFFSLVWCGVFVHTNSGAWAVQTARMGGRMGSGRMAGARLGRRVIPALAGTRRKTRSCSCLPGRPRRGSPRRSAGDGSRGRR